MAEIPDRLLQSATHLGALPSGALLLKDNAHYPWFMIVPGGEFVEWIDLPLPLQQLLLTDINVLSRFLLERRPPTRKVNVGAIGNIVPRFHLHVVGRHPEDPAWPGPVWGHPEQKAYEEGEIAALTKQLVSGLPNFVEAS